MKDKPNVIVFFTDQQRWDTTGVHGNPLGLTPNFDRMAQAGTHCFNAFTCQPVCAPARACLQTGKYATNTGVYRNALTLGDDQKTLAHYFKEGGYDTAYIGKWHLADREPVPRDRQGGYDYWLGANALEHTSDTYRTLVYDRDGKEVFLPGYRVDALTDAAIRYISGERAGPFFLFVSFLEPHHQNHVDDYPPPEGYREPYTGRWIPGDLAALGGSSARHLGGYFGMVKRLDEALGRLSDALRSLKILDNTIILYTADHGNHFKTRNGEYKRSCHEASIRIPMALSGPGFSGGGRVTELVSLVDMPPTLLDAAGLPVPGEMEGRSLLDGRKNWPDDVFIQISESQTGRAVRTRRWKYGVTAPDADGWKDRDSPVYVEQYLYDLEHDPHELANLIDMVSHQDVCKAMKARLLKRIKEVEGNEPSVTEAERSPSGQRKVYPEEI
ncbi:MAG: sulfatase-like hydrolase/transferase [Treponema sp.]|jgi:arylsulfatase A-like enzyme|nr:sulfatase-like hydrolase/transferase [Treponema sp.]